MVRFFSDSVARLTSRIGPYSLAWTLSIPLLRLQYRPRELAPDQLLFAGNHMRFVGKVWRLLVGIKDGLVLILMLLLFGTLYAALSASPRVPASTRGALLLKLTGTLVEQPATAEPFDHLSGSP
jgi:hypothetical protein